MFYMPALETGEPNMLRKLAALIFVTLCWITSFVYAPSTVKVGVILDKHHHDSHTVRFLDTAVETINYKSEMNLKMELGHIFFSNNTFRYQSHFQVNFKMLMFHVSG